MSATQAAETTSIESQDPNFDGKAKVKSRRPANTAFRQQRLKAWQPILTTKTVVPLFFVVGIIFAPIGGLLIYASSQVQEITIDYSRCATDAPYGNDATDFAQMPSNYTSSFFKASSNVTSPPMWRRNTTIMNYSPGNVDLNTTVCSIQFTIPDNLKPPVYLYYRLTNFYQNHRRYVKSLDTDQLQGKALSNSTINGGACDPLKLDPTTGKAYYPCGLIANSLFNDTFTSPVLLNVRDGSADNITYPMTNKGIAWSSDKNLYGTTAYTVDQVVPPPSWAPRWPNGTYTEDSPFPILAEDEEFQVWMRTAGLPTFAKLALRNDNQTMEAGTYQIDIGMNFPVTEYGGTKSVLISTRTVMGGRNPSLGIAYVVIGGLCVLLGAIFALTHLIRPRKLGDHSYLSWNNETPGGGRSLAAGLLGRGGGGGSGTAAVATGRDS